MIQRTESDWRRHREMSEALRKICVDAVGQCEDLPQVAKDNKNAIDAIEITRFDQSYLEFLDGQIALEPRGPKWSERLEVRRAKLAKHVGRELASCRLRLEDSGFSLQIDPLTGVVVHWEMYKDSFDENSS